MIVVKNNIEYEGVKLKLTESNKEFIGINFISRYPTRSWRRFFYNNYSKYIKNEYVVNIDKAVISRDSIFLLKYKFNYYNRIKLIIRTI